MEPVHREWEERGLRAAILSGDEAAWRVLYERYFDALYAYSFARVGRDPDRAQEVVQECWMVAVRRVRAFEPARGSFGQWLRGIADRVILGQQRRWARRNRLARNEPPVPESTGPIVPSDAGERVARVLLSLPAPYAAVLRAKYAEQLAVADIARGWGRSVKAVESLLSRARTAFREAWSRVENEPTNRRGRDHHEF